MTRVTAKNPYRPVLAAILLAKVGSPPGVGLVRNIKLVGTAESPRVTGNVKRWCAGIPWTVTDVTVEIAPALAAMVRKGGAQ